MNLNLETVATPSHQELVALTNLKYLTLEMISVKKVVNSNNVVCKLGEN